MTLGADFNTLSPLFDFNNNGGVLFPFTMQGEFPYIDFDAVSGSVFAKLKVPCKMRIITVDMIGCSDTGGVKDGAASTEPIVAIGHGPSGVGTVASLSDVMAVTIAGSIDAQARITTSTTASTLEKGDELWAYLKQTCTAATSGNGDGGATIVIWLAAVNSP